MKRYSRRLMSRSRSTTSTSASWAAERDELQHKWSHRDRCTALAARLASAEAELLRVSKLHPYYTARGMRWCATCTATRWPCPTISSPPGVLAADTEQEAGKNDE